MSESNNVDNILIPSEQAMALNEKIPSEPVQQQAEAPVEQSVENVSQPEVAQEPESQAAEPIEQQPEVAKDDSPIDEYGNPIEKPRTYTEDEVNRMIRERLSRGRHQEQQPTQQQVKQATDEFKADPNSEESWEAQLETFIDRTIAKREAKLSEKQWQQQESQRQAEFEEKFTMGMSKYQDFEQVIKGKPLTTHMMLAARNLENPAAFVYGAAKMHPQELDRISKIADPYAQAAEVGKLHEKMVKERRITSAAPKSLETPKGDMGIKAVNQPSLEQRITEYAKSKRR